MVGSDAERSRKGLHGVEAGDSNGESVFLSGLADGVGRPKVLENRAARSWLAAEGNPS